VELEFFGKIVIRTFYCRHFKIRYSLIPSFITPHRIISPATADKLFATFKNHNSIFQTINHVIEDLDEHFYFPISTISKLIREHKARAP